MLVKGATGRNPVYQYHGIYKALNISHIKLFWWSTERYISISHHFATLKLRWYLNVWNHISWNTIMFLVSIFIVNIKVLTAMVLTYIFLIFSVSATDEVIFHALFELRPDFFCRVRCNPTVRTSLYCNKIFMAWIHEIYFVSRGGRCLTKRMPKYSKNQFCWNTRVSGLVGLKHCDYMIWYFWRSIYRNEISRDIESYTCKI